LQRIILFAALTGKIVFFDAGTYKVTSTLYIPQNSKLVGESYSVIMSSGNFFANINFPQPVVRVGLPRESGTIEWSDMIVSTQGAQAGAILIEWNLASWYTFRHVGCAYPHWWLRRLKSTSSSMSDHPYGQHTASPSQIVLYRCLPIDACYQDRY
jgi:hypothetical protein